MSSNAEGIGCLVGIAVIAVIVFGIAYFTNAIWANRIYYFFQVDADSGWDRVHIEKKPHDCEFMAAPFGETNCHYEKVVTIIKWATRNGDGFPIRSFDDGQTWEVHIPGKCEFDPSLDCPNVYDPPNNVAPKYISVTGITVGWKKVQD